MLEAGVLVRIQREQMVAARRIVGHSGDGSRERCDDAGVVANVGGDWRPSDQGTSAALEVENFGEAISELRNECVRFAAEPFETPCCHMAVVHDPDGNKIIIHKLKPENEKGVCK